MEAASAVERRLGDRRHRRMSLRYPERRSGFDRRAVATTAWSRMIAAYRERGDLVAWCAAAVVVLSAADLLLTRRLLDLGATEVNPVMASLLGNGLLPAAALKAVVTLPVAAAIWRLRAYRRVLEVSLAITVSLGALVAYQLVGLALAG